MGAFAAFFPALLNLLTGFLENRQKIGEAKTVAKIEQQKIGATSFTGRLLVLFWFYPAVACYVPALQESAGLGFKLLSAMPEWHLGILGGITTAVLGVEGWKGIRK